MSKLVLTKDPSHNGYYQDADGNLYVFRFGGRPIKVDDYREDKYREKEIAGKNAPEEITTVESAVIDHTKNASDADNKKYYDNLEQENMHFEGEGKELVAKEYDKKTNENALINDYKTKQGVDDDWFVEEGRKLGLSDEELGKEVYDRKGIALNSTDDNIKRIVANKEKEVWEKKLDKYNEIINDPKTGDWDRNFAKSEIKGIENEIERYSQYEAEFIRRLNRDDDVFTVKYSDGEFTENFKAVGLDEAFAMQDEWNRYGDTKIYDMDGNEIKYDMNRKHYTSPTYEENKIKTMRNNYKSRLYGADRSTLVSMVHNLGLNWNVERFTDAQLYRMLEKELNKK